MPSLPTSLLCGALLATACTKPQHDDTGSSTPTDETTPARERDAATTSTRDGAAVTSAPGAVGSSSATQTSLATSTEAPAEERCPDTACPDSQCCVDGKACGTYVLVKDFPRPCMLAGDMNGTLDQTCPQHACEDPRAKCTFEGCRTTDGQCGIWLDSYGYQAGGEGFQYNVNLGCVLISEK